MADGRGWVRARFLTPDEKAAITAACDRLIADKLKPHYLPEIRPTQFNYPIDLFGRWRGSNYSFITRFRSGFADNAGEEFDAPFARLDHLAECLADIRFNVMWLRHNGRWWLLHSSVVLEDALNLIETDPVLQPPI